MKWMPRLVGHDLNVTLIDAVAAEVHVEFHFLLQHHNKLTGIIVSAVEFVGIVQAINVLPTAPGKGFEKVGPTDVGENFFPVQRLSEIAKRLFTAIGGWLVRR